MIIIAGTHRSGSSYVAGLLHESGLSLGPEAEFLPADAANPRGYFEQRSVVDLNSLLITGFSRTRLLESLACRGRYALLPSIDGIRRRARRHTAAMQGLGERFAHSIIKDPRFSLTYPVWANHAPFTGFVVVIRHPEASARSMHRRDWIPRQLAYAFWNYHVEHLLQWLPTTETLFIDFDRLAGADAVEELDRMHSYFAPPMARETFVSRGRAMFAADLRHWAPSDDTDLPASTQALWARLTALSAGHRAAFAAGARLRPGVA